MDEKTVDLGISVGYKFSSLEEFEKRLNNASKSKTLRKESLCPAHIHIKISDSGKEFIVTSVNNTHNHVVTEIEGVDTFRDLAFFTRNMIMSLSSYPEIICIDATYKLLHVKAPVYVILNEDGNGESTIVGMGILVQEDEESLQWFLDIFKSQNTSWVKIRNIMSDKDITEREILKKCFPEAQLHICIFHVLKIFQREITTEKFKITSTTHNEILEILQKMVYSKSNEEFDTFLNKIKSNYPERIFNYLTSNWLHITNEWCSFLGPKVFNFMNHTNNRLEGINAKLKSIIQKHSSLEDFVDGLYVAITSLEKEKNARIANVLNKSKPLHFKDKYKLQYYKYLTPNAFEKLERQFIFENIKFTKCDDYSDEFIVDAKDLTIQATRSTCTCYFFNSMGLPCKHKFAITKYLNGNLFQPTLVLERWTMAYFLQHCSFIKEPHIQHTTAIPSGSSSEVVNIDILPEKNYKATLTSQERYLKNLAKQSLSEQLHEDIRRIILMIETGGGPGRPSGGLRPFVGGGGAISSSFGPPSPQYGVPSSSYGVPHHSDRIVGIDLEDIKQAILVAQYYQASTVSFGGYPSGPSKPSGSYGTPY
ncbi:hypothetical protein ILUMI_00282 [Ignelater luminosus]|uniref:SWIM-type domain-containing protein n=1 Tax=Ignelater luminosus TaxID=2038154 RepID=A0A8K0GLE1_IGNLU|nr:hypothetical protein ILUMI_00282 [Ignelater luminosus]